MAQQTIATTDSPETGRGKINENFTEVYDIDNLLPSQTGNSGKFLVTNGTTASWQSASATKKYVALVNQSGTSAPTATVLENSFTGAIFYSFSDTGEFSVASASAEFTQNKTMCRINNTLSTFVNCAFQDTETITMSSKSNSDTPANGVLVNAVFEIVVYP